MFSSPTFLAVFAPALALAGCSGGNHERPAPGEDSLELSGSARVPVARASHVTAAEAVLDVSTASPVTSYLGAVHGIVTSASGEVVAGAERDVDEATASAAPELSFVLPGDGDYTVSLSAATDDARPTTCRATVGPLRVEAGTVAKLQVLAWDCGERVGYLPSEPSSECFWLAEWSFVSRVSAAVGHDISVSAAGHDAQGQPARFDWSTDEPGSGTFAEPHASSTSFRCRTPGQALPLIVSISDTDCQKQLFHRVSCL